MTKLMLIISWHVICKYFYFTTCLQQVFILLLDTLWCFNTKRGTNCSASKFDTYPFELYYIFHILDYFFVLQCFQIFFLTIRNFYDKEFNFSIVQFQFWGGKKERSVQKKTFLCYKFGCAMCSSFFKYWGGFCI